jgi:hypothetical protein
MLVALQGTLWNTKLFIHVYLWVYIYLINITMGEQLLRRGDLGSKGEKRKEIHHPGRELGGLKRILILSGLFSFLKFLLTLGKVFSWAPRQTKMGIK